jgi:hypothetical protein
MARRDFCFLFFGGVEFDLNANVGSISALPKNKN